jgi:hypothetical protein
MSEIKAKRGRRKKCEIERDNQIIAGNIINESENIQIQINESKTEEPPVKVLKKRGRKPKGGKLMVLPEQSIDNEVFTKNVILHLKCSQKDLINTSTQENNNIHDPLVYNPSVPPNISTYDQTQTHNKFFTPYQSQDIIESDKTNIKPIQDAYESNILCVKCRNSECINDSESQEINTQESINNVSLKDVHNKLKKLKIQYYKNVPNNKNSSCFWCTYEFDNPPCYIPKYEIDDVIHGYGSFCRPECAVGFLMKENLDDSTKFERYHLLNRIYGKIFGFHKNIKPAPNPYYLLDKFYGSLTIQEYRKLLQTEYLLSVVDKPMTRFLPEIHEDNDEFIMNIYGESKHTTQSGGMYKVKRASEKQSGPSKNSIIQNKFGGGNV